MRVIIPIIAFLVLFTAIAFTQVQPKDDLQTVKDALVNQVAYTQQLEKVVNENKVTLNRISEDLLRIKTVAQLDSLKRAYGLIKDEKENKDTKK